MGSAYSAVSTADDTDLLARAVKHPPTVCRSATFHGKLPIIRNPVHTDTINSIGPVRPGMILTASSDTTVGLINVDTGEMVTRWRGHTKSVTKVAYKLSQTKHFVLSGSRDHTAKLWAFNSDEPKQTYQHDGPVTAVCNLLDNQIATGSRDTFVRIFDVESTKPLLEKSINRNLVTHLARIPNTQLLVQTSEDRITRIYDSSSLEIVKEFPIKSHIQYHCSLSNDGRFCATTSGGTNGDGCDITIYDMRQQKQYATLKGHSETVRCAVFLPQTITCKKLLLSCGDDKSIRLWSVDDSRCQWYEASPTGTALTSCYGFGDGNIVIAGHDAAFAHMKMNGRAGVPFLHTMSLQSMESERTPFH
uniref:WD_REPEATS_REGION domain-containing protein n=1 Tax=Panagrellus redivivus TaxID=6233 RepID=A0A7E4W449_PANRE